MAEQVKTLTEGVKWEPECYITRTVHVWHGANKYEALISHRTGMLSPEEIIEDWPSAPRLWLPVCWICERTVEGDGRTQDDGYWVHHGDCQIEDLNRGLENMERMSQA